MAHPHPDDDLPSLDNWGRPTFRAVEEESQINQRSNEENERRGNSNHPNRENITPRWFRPNTQSLDNYNRCSQRRQNITHLDYSDDDVLFWLERHGRTVQAPELNVHQMMQMDYIRTTQTLSLITRWFRVVNYFRARYSRGELGVEGNVAWMDDMSNFWDVQWSDPDDEFYDPAYENRPRAPRLDTDMDVDSGYDSEPPFDPVFGSGNDGNNNDDEELIDWTPPWRPSQIEFGMTAFRRSITPDERVTFDYFYLHPELATPMSAYEYRERHRAGTAHDAIHNHEPVQEESCPFAPDTWIWCYNQTLLRLYARLEQAAINQFVYGYDDDENNLMNNVMNEQFLLAYEKAPEEDDPRYRRIPNDRQWRTSPNEGRQDWMWFAARAFQNGIIPPFESEELAAAAMFEEE